MTENKRAAEEQPALRPVPLPGFHLVGEDGNAFAIFGRFLRAARAEGIDKPVIDAVMVDAKSGDYNHLLSVFIPWESEDADD